MEFSIIYKDIQNLISIFSTRELAYLSWLAIIICLIISSPKLRKSVWNVLRLLFNWKFNIIYLLTLGHFYGLIYVLSIFGFWDKSLLKDTIYWVLLSASMLMYRIATNKAPLNFLKNAIKDNVKLSVFLSFVMTLATFNFWIEFIAIPIISITCWNAHSRTIQKRVCACPKDFRYFGTDCISLIVNISCLLCDRPLQRISQHTKIKGVYTSDYFNDTIYPFSCCTKSLCAV